MTTEGLIAVLGGVAVALAVRLSNMVCKWLSRVLKVEPPAPIEAPET